TGAKLSLDYQAEYTGSDRRNAVENSFRLGLSDCFGLISGFVDPLDRSTFKGVAQPRITFEAIGGDPSKISVDERSANNPVVNTTEWIESINEETARFVYLHDTNGLLPIYNLISDTQKKEEVKDYIDDYLKRNAVKIKYFAAQHKHRVPCRCVDVLRRKIQVRRRHEVRFVANNKNLRNPDDVIRKSVRTVWNKIKSDETSNYDSLLSVFNFFSVKMNAFYYLQDIECRLE